MKIVKAMKVVARLKGEVKDLKHRMKRCLNAAVGNDYKEDYKGLATNVETKIERIIGLKNGIMRSNINDGMFEKIVKLGELKSSIVFLRELDPKIGEDTDRFRENDVVYKSQLTTKEIVDLIEVAQKDIDKLTDELDDFNAKTDI